MTDGPDTKKFSIILCFRDTPRERKLAQRSIPSAIRLGPAELVVGIDEPARDGFPEYITGICEKNGFGNVRIVRVPNTDDWNFQLAHTLWECYCACTYDKVLGFGVDEELRGDVMLGYDIVGRDGVAVVSFTKKLLIRTPGDCIRYAMCRIMIKSTDCVFSGTYWIYRPYYFANVKREEVQRLSNGVDVYMYSCITKQKTHKIVMRKEIGVSCMNYQNEDYPWRQFAAGMWFYANRGVSGAAVPERFKKHNAGIMTRIVRYIMKFPFLFVMIKAVAYQRPGMISGWRWAAKHRDSEAVTEAAGMSYDEWGMYGCSKHVRKIKKFDGGTTGLA